MPCCSNGHVNAQEKEEGGGRREEEGGGTREEAGVQEFRSLVCSRREGEREGRGKEDQINICENIMCNLISPRLMEGERSRKRSRTLALASTD